MKTHHLFLLGVPALLLGLPPDTTPVRAADPKEVSKNIIAVQIRKQGFECKTPLSAERDTTTGNPDDPVWTLRCDGVSYRVHLVPNQAAKVERLPDDRQSSQSTTQQP
jgi:hypothetical protein